MILRSSFALKSTGLIWAECIPIDWQVVPLKHVCAFTTGWTPPSGDASSYEGENLWANISDIGEHTLLNPAKRLSDEAVEYHGMVPSPVGSLLFSFKLSIGQVSFVGREMFTNEAIATFLPSERLSLPFAYYAFPLMVPQNASVNIYGAKMLNQQLIQSAPLVLPPLPEQTAIAAFLDRETAKIDGLVEEQKRLIELLKEKRQAVISHAVTKGLNPDARMKYSGIEWLGEVPEHWEVDRLSRLARPGSVITYGIVQAGPNIEGGVPYIRTSDMANDELSLDGLLRTSAEIDASYARSRISTGDLVIAIRATIGKPLIVPPELEGANLTQGTAKFSPGKRILNQYAAYFLRTAEAISEFERVAKGATFKEITLDTLRRFPVPVPPIDEQHAICCYAMEQDVRLRQLIGDVETSILLLQERRSALISAAVTGKINVQSVSDVENAA